MKKLCRSLAVLIFAIVLLGPVLGFSLGAQQQPAMRPAAKPTETDPLALPSPPPPTPSRIYELRPICLHFGGPGEPERIKKFQSELDVWAKKGYDFVEAIPMPNHPVGSSFVRDCKLLVFRHR